MDEVSGAGWAVLGLGAVVQVVMMAVALRVLLRPWGEAADLFRRWGDAMNRHPVLLFWIPMAISVNFLAKSAVRSVEESPFHALFVLTSLVAMVITVTIWRRRPRTPEATGDSTSPNPPGAGPPGQPRASGFSS